MDGDFAVGLKLQPTPNFIPSLVESIFSRYNIRLYYYMATLPLARELAVDI